MEQSRLSAGNDERNIIKEENGRTLILPLERRVRRPRFLKTAFYFFLMGFFVLCVWLVIRRLSEESALASSTVFDTLIRWGIGVPK